MDVDARGAGNSEGDVIFWGEQVCSIKLAQGSWSNMHCRKQLIYMIPFPGLRNNPGATVLL